MADVTIKPITRLLVANRGEIARRIFRTANEMGISTVAVYADGDADAPFVKEADLAIALGGESSAETYLDAAKVIALGVANDMSASAMVESRKYPEPAVPLFAIPSTSGTAESRWQESGDSTRCARA